MHLTNAFKVTSVIFVDKCLLYDFLCFRLIFFLLKTIYIVYVIDGKFKAQKEERIRNLFIVCAF